MKSVRSVKNQYLGINAHLNSHWQANGGWNGFHTMHISDLTRVMKARLFPMGYTADIQKGLQIKHVDEPIGDPEAGVMIYDSDPVRPFQPPSSSWGSAGEMVVALPEILKITEPELRYYWAVGIYTAMSRESSQGTPVAWVELLSPSNKPGGPDAVYYRTKRLELLQSGVVFVEIDYLHESAPTFAGLASYRNRGRKKLPEPGSHAYHIVVIDPRPAFMEGQGHIFDFNVDDPIPTVSIPLNADDTLKFDFGAPYKKTFEESLYGLEWVDYKQLPPNFDRYSEADQARIVARMLAVMDAAQRGEDLETGPFPVKPISLEAGLAEIEHWSKG